MREYRIYKPNQKNNGSASRLQFSVKKVKKGDKEYDKKMVFWEGTLQTGVDQNGNASFGWKDATKKVIFKLGEIDIGEILSVLNGVKSGVGTDPSKGLFHKNPKGNATLQFAFVSQEGKLPNYKLSMSSQKNGQVIRVSHFITLAEAEIVKVYLQDCLRSLFV